MFFVFAVFTFVHPHFLCMLAGPVTPQLINLNQVALFLLMLILLPINVVDSMQLLGTKDVGEDVKIVLVSSTSIGF
jgi:hypothetical protein